MKIRLFNKKLDSDYVLSTFVDVFSNNEDFEYTRDGFEEFKREINKYESDCDFGLIYVLEDETINELAGYIFISFKDVEIFEKSKLFLDKLYVDKDYGKDLELLLDKVKDVAKEKNIKSIELESVQSNLG